MKKLIINLGLVWMIAGGVRAELFMFILTNNAPWDSTSSAVYTNTGSGAFSLEASMYTYLDGSRSSNSLLNSTTSAFGINSSGTADDAAYFDTNNGQEAIWISFNRSVQVKSIAVSSFAGSNVETGAYQVAEGGVINFTSSGTYTVDEVLNQGSFFKITAVNEGGGNGWSLNSFTVEAVPEPATALMLGVGCMMTCVIRRLLFS